MNTKNTNDKNLISAIRTRGYMTHALEAQIYAQSQIWLKHYDYVVSDTDLDCIITSSESREILRQKNGKTLVTNGIKAMQAA